MKMFYSQKVPVVIAVIIILIFLVGNNNFRNLIRQYQEIYRLKQERFEIEKKNAKLKREIYLLEKEGSYIENIARRELGVISKDEVEYRFRK
ncbi:MAG: septum formation initiator family protein [Elusimicrobia bacterium]|nr:septum formation initiator family protein [Elusimicrobiota bacterium]